MNNEPDYFSVRCTVTHIKTDQRSLWYVACPTCKKKVQGVDDENNNLNGHCEKCNQTVTGVRRWIFSAACNDASGSRYLNFFDDCALPLLGNKTADELAPLKFNSPNEFDQHFMSSSFKMYQFKCRYALAPSPPATPLFLSPHAAAFRSIKAESYNEESRLKVSCLSLTEVDFVAEGQLLLGEIARLRY